MTGTIKATINERGFGFIASALGDHFFHADDLVEGTSFANLREEDRVTFEEVLPIPPKGRRAVKVAAATPEPA
jgi:cold shock CspA family protein